MRISYSVLIISLFTLISTHSRAQTNSVETRTETSTQEVIQPKPAEKKPTAKKASTAKSSQTKKTAGKNKKPVTTAKEIEKTTTAVESLPELQKPVLTTPTTTTEPASPGISETTQETTLPSPEVSSPTVTTPPTAPGVPPQVEAAKPSSRNARDGKMFYAAIEAGFPIAPIPAIGLQGGYYLNSQNLLQAELTQGKIGWSFLSVKATTAGLHLKHFFGNSLYGKAGIDYRKVDIGEPSIPGAGQLTPDTGRAETLAASFAFGNQWHWDTYSLGIDWFGVMIPVTTIKQDLNRQGFGGSELAKMDEIWDRVARLWSVEVLRVSVGMSF